MTSGRALYCVLVDERVEKDLRGVPEYIFDKFVKILGELEIDPVNRRPGIDIKKLKGYSNIFRIRIGKYRIFYSVDNESHIVRITAVVHRKKAYRVFESNTLQRYESTLPNNGQISNKKV